MRTALKIALFEGDVVVNPELFENGDFSDGTVDGWGNALRNPTPTNDSLRLKLTSTALGSGYGGKGFEVENGKTYNLLIDCVETTDANFQIMVGTGLTTLGDIYSSGGLGSAPQSLDAEFTATSTGTYYLQCRSGGNTNLYCIYDNISVKEVLYGDDLMVNGDFSSGLTNYLYVGTSVVDGRAYINTATVAYFRSNVTLETGVTYRIDFDVEVISGTPAIEEWGGGNRTEFTSADNGSFTAYATIAQAEKKMVWGWDSSACEFYVDNITIREVL